MRPCLPRIGFNALVLSMVFGVTGSPAMATEADDQTEIQTFPRELTVRSFATGGTQRYFGTGDGLWRRTEWHEAEEADRIWGQPKQPVAGVAVWGDTVVVAAGRTLALGSVEDPASWQDVLVSAIVPRPAQPWQDVRLLAWRFVARADRYYTSKEGD